MYHTRANRISTPDTSLAFGPKVASDVSPGASVAIGPPSFILEPVPVPPGMDNPIPEPPSVLVLAPVGLIVVRSVDIGSVNVVLVIVDHV